MRKPFSTTGPTSSSSSYQYCSIPLTESSRSASYPVSVLAQAGLRHLVPRISSGKCDVLDPRTPYQFWLPLGGHPSYPVSVLARQGPSYPVSVLALVSDGNLVPRISSGPLGLVVASYPVSVLAGMARPGLVPRISSGFKLHGVPRTPYQFWR
jgi:hypothetical protein